MKTQSVTEKNQHRKAWNNCNDKVVLLLLLLLLSLLGGHNRYPQKWKPLWDKDMHSVPHRIHHEGHHDLTGIILSGFMFYDVWFQSCQINKNQS